MSSLIPNSLFGTRALIDRRFDDILNNFFDYGTSGYPSSNLANSLPMANVSKSDTGYEISIAAPGYSRDAFDIKVNDGVLTITGNLEDSTQGEVMSQMTSQEFNYGTFTRSWTLPAEVSGESITASYIAGILNIGVPVEANKSRVIDINVD